MDRNIIDERKSIALVAHDYKKTDLMDWVGHNRGLLSQHRLYATGTTGKLIEEHLGIGITRLQSGPLGGDQQLGALISEGKIDLMIFFWDPLEPQPHDPDVKALLRIAVVWNIPIACNRATADFIVTSPLMSSQYRAGRPNYDGHTSRKIDPTPDLEAEGELKDA